LTGENGKNGVDGRVIEFIYRLLPDLNTYNLLVRALSYNKLESPNIDNSVPIVNDNLNIGTS
jgi:hypothetical protein